MVSSFKLNAGWWFFLATMFTALPISSSDFPSDTSQCATLFGCDSPKYVEIESLASKSQLSLPHCSPTGFSNEKTNQTRQHSNSLSMACTVNGMLFIQKRNLLIAWQGCFRSEIIPKTQRRLPHLELLFHQE